MWQLPKNFNTEESFHECRILKKKLIMILFLIFANWSRILLISQYSRAYLLLYLIKLQLIFSTCLIIKFSWIKHKIVYESVKIELLNMKILSHFVMNKFVEVYLINLLIRIVITLGDYDCTDNKLHKPYFFVDFSLAASQQYIAYNSVNEQLIFINFILWNAFYPIILQSQVFIIPVISISLW